MNIDYRIRSVDGYTKNIGELVSMLEHTRAVTLQEINELSVEQLDLIMPSGGNSIGALLKHIAAIEKAHQLISFQKRDFTKEELEIWEDALYLGEAGKSIRGYDIPYYVQLLQSVREESLKYLSKVDDTWLMSERKWPKGVAYNQHYLWFHVIEDEISHRGQIRMLKKKLFENYVK
ncbi:DinB family protein [Bacillus mycoides]|uniref:DinB family protein n=1 Tax=Bacillus mycoides TaxID=1405 RepID=UPI00285353AB|nr:DinB family protein [Bacillus mycoides]MDR4901396.1 DinB family protein [Bacillus mycoides]MED1012231.1 DinB family protein [Bacillus mycoides]MED1046506.1 DinB family protein [Bacillus mycoides]MED1051383.1 DinB family protein [Bacillus mycoides]MED1084357.1 DinB family protein [Bacillus mycoides]